MVKFGRRKKDNQSYPKENSGDQKIYIPSFNKTGHRLFVLQDELIEHKYPLSGTPELYISHAGDIYREIADGREDPSYVDEKVSGLERGVSSLRWSDIDDINDDMKYQEKQHGRTYLEMKREYLENLKKLREETEKTLMEPYRKKLLLKCLDLIPKLIICYENGPYMAPEKEVQDLSKAVDKFYEDRKSFLSNQNN